jgi:hypothetical protein
MHEPLAPADFLNGAGHHPEFHNNDLAAFKTQGNASTKRSPEDNVDIAKPAKVARLNQTCKSSMLNKLIDLTMRYQHYHLIQNQGASY